MNGSDYDLLLTGHRVVELAGQTLKVACLPDGRMLELFTIRLRFSKALLFPRAVTFARNSERLRELGVDTLAVEQVFLCSSRSVWGVIYPIIPGESLDLGPLTRERRAGFARLLSKLHSRGVYFRSMHLGNVLETDDGSFALIDVADIRFLRAALSDRLRVRNFHHLLRKPEHRKQMLDSGYDEFVDEYLAACCAAEAECAGKSFSAKRLRVLRNDLVCAIKRNTSLE